MDFFIKYSFPWRLRDRFFFKMVNLSNLDCLFPAADMTDFYRFLANDGGYIPQQSSRWGAGWGGVPNSVFNKKNVCLFRDSISEISTLIQINSGFFCLIRYSMACIIR